MKYVGREQERCDQWRVASDARATSGHQLKRKKQKRGEAANLTSTARSAKTAGEKGEELKYALQDHNQA